MSISTDGQICFGILFEEGYLFPWQDGWDDFDDWYLDVNGYKKTFEIYDKNGIYFNGVKPSEETIESYYQARRDFFKILPEPPSIVNYCSDGYPMYILAVPSSVITANRGYPEEFIPSCLKVSEKEINELVSFCETFCKTSDDDVFFEPKWYLSSYKD